MSTEAHPGLSAEASHEAQPTARRRSSRVADEDGPVWGAGLRDDVRALSTRIDAMGDRLERAVTRQTLILAIVPVIAMVLIAGVVVFSINLSLTDDGLELETTRDAPAATP